MTKTPKNAPSSIGIFFLMIFSTVLAAQSTPVPVASSSWVWNVELARGKIPPATEADLPGIGKTRFAWHPEIDAAGNFLGWVVIMGEASENALINRSQEKGPQPCQFFGWQFVPVASEPMGLVRRFNHEWGELEILVLNFEVKGQNLVRLSARCSWYPGQGKPGPDK